MFDWDAIIIGGGPAGLTAGIYLSRANRRVIILEKESLGGQPKNVDWVENYPGFAGGISGPQLATEMVAQAERFGVKTELANVSGLEIFSSCRWVGCSDGRGYTAALVIVAGGAKHKRLGVPGEDLLSGKGVFECALCDGGQYADKVVAVCGGGDSALSEALYMAKIASKVIVIHRRKQLRSTGVLLARAMAEPKIEFLLDGVVESIGGGSRVESVKVRNVETGQAKEIKTDGVLVQVGVEPNTDYLGGLVKLDSQRQIAVDGNMQTDLPYVLAAGDVRSGSPRQIAAAVGDGAIAGITAQRLLDELG